MRTETINKNDGNQRLDKYMSKRFRTMPQSLLYKYIRNKCVKVNGVRAKENTVVMAGDEITYYISDEFFLSKKSDFTSLSPTLNVVYEDENVLIADKPAGMSVQPDEKQESNTLVDNVKAYLYKKGEYDPERENSFAPALCNRIDRNTSGLVIAAKNAEALRIMNDIIKEREIEKTYLAAVHGILAKKEDTVTVYIEKNASENMVKVYKKPSSDTKTAITGYKVIAEEKDLSLLEIRLITGRTHQIRATFAYLGHPLLGDGKYAVNKDDRKKGYTCQQLCSYTVKFAFKTDRGILNYLNGKTVKAKTPAFVSLFE
ncbi:MAG: RluA family pseudouridine synthase [Clostridia bacterium]|nr:RluA family pseudouridine synthase [Clostridia bacterium]